MLFKTKLVSSMEKVFCDEELNSPEFKCASALRGEVFAFQIAYWGDTLIKNIKIELESAISELISVRSVGYVPCDYVGASFDDNVLRQTAGLYPDPLYPVKDVIHALPFQWRSIWLTVKLPEDCKAGKYDITVRFSRDIPDQPESCIDCRETFSLEVLPVTLPRQKMLHTEWFHADCIASYYQTPCWSEKHWELIGKYAADNAFAHTRMSGFMSSVWLPQ